MIQLPNYRQGDAQWGSKIMSPSNLDMANYGCFVTSLSMMIANYAINKNPGEVCDALIKVNGFDQWGMLQHDAIGKAFPGVYFKERVYTTDDPRTNLQRVNVDVARARIKRLLSLGQPVLLTVDAQQNDKIADHAIVAIDTAGADDFVILDPWYGEKTLYSKRYVNLYGYLAYLGSPINFPDFWGEPKIGQAVYKLIQAKKGVNKDMNISEALDVLL